MNKVILIGRIVRDVEVRYSQGATPMAVAKYTLAVDRRFKKDGEPAADFINCVAFGKNGEFAEKYLSKGTKIAVEGHWQTGSYKNKDGNTVYTNDCVIDSQEFCESKSTQRSAPQPMPSNDNSWMDIPNDIQEELPFV